MLAGCNDGDKVNPDTGSFAYGKPDCHGSDNDCEPVYRIESDYVRLCFGWDGPTQSWPPGTPQVVLDECPNPELTTYCVFSYDTEQDVECTNVCGECIPLHSDDPGDTGGFPIDGIAGPDDDCCDCDVAYTGLDDLHAALNACAMNFGLDLRQCPDPEWILQSDQECEFSETTPTSFAMAPGANFVLYVDPLESYITLATTGGSQVFAVAGGGTAKTSTDQFMTATLWAADGTLVGTSFTDWVFWTTAPIDYDPNSGNFTVYAAQAPVFHGRGYIDSSPMLAEIVMANNATGNVNTTTMTWQADYSQTSGSDTIQLHLEGTLDTVP